MSKPEVPKGWTISEKARLRIGAVAFLVSIGSTIATVCVLALGHSALPLLVIAFASIGIYIMCNA